MPIRFAISQQWMIATAAISLSTATIASTPRANSEGKFDGRWSAVLVTKSGPCQPAYRGAVQVINGTVQVEGANNVLTGRVASNGSVLVRGSMGANYGTAWGRLLVNSGGGRWRVHMQDGECLGVWTAQRLMSR